MSKTTCIVAQALTVLLACAAGAEAQDARWAPWLGCWEPTDAQGRSQAIQICVVPNEAGVRMVTFAGEQLLLDEPVVADGTTQTLTDNECTLTRNSRFAARAARLFTTTGRQCAAEPASQTSGLSTILNGTQWLDIQVSGAAGRESIRTRRYARATAAPPAALGEGMHRLPVSGAVTDARPAVDDVIEASRAVSARAIEAWLVETEPQMTIDRRALRQLTGGRVTEPVIDLLVALAYPRHFDVKRPSTSSGGPTILTGEGTLEPWLSWAGPWAVDPYSFYYSPFGPWSTFDSYSYYGPYDTGGYIIIGGGGTPVVASSHGQVVNGQGYTRVQPHVDAVASDGGRSTAGADSSGGGDGSFSGGASPAGYSGGGGATATGLTAVPR